MVLRSASTGETSSEIRRPYGRRIRLPPLPLEGGLLARKRSPCPKAASLLENGLAHADVIAIFPAASSSEHCQRPQQGRADPDQRPKKLRLLGHPTGRNHRDQRQRDEGNRHIAGGIEQIAGIK